jgi:alpha-glucosidase
MQKVKEYKIPCEGLFVSSKISKENKIDNLQSIIKSNFKVALNVKGQIDIKQPIYKILESKDYFIKNEFGNSYKIENNGTEYSLIDFTNDKACIWWKTYIKELFRENSYSGIWYEQKSFEIDDPGVDVYNIQSISSQIMCDVFQEAMNELTKNNNKKRNWITNKDEKYKLYNSCNTDIIKSNDLLTTSQLMRAIENAVLSTSFVIPNALYRYLSEELQNSNEILSKILELAKAHYAFLPFIYNVAFQSHSKGIPIYRNLSLEFEDERVDLESTECLFGDNILKVYVNNEEQSQKDVYLPKDYHWYNSANKKFYYGGAKIEIDASLGLFNYFVKEGSIIPINKEIGKKLKTALFKNIDLKIYRIKDNKKTVSHYFEDDGITSLNEERFNSYKFELSRNRLIVTKTKCAIKSSRRIFNICNEVGTKVSCFDPDKLEEGESISYKL